MLVTRKSKNLNVSLTQTLKFDWKAALPVADFHPSMLFSMEKFLLCGWPTLVQSHLSFKIRRLKLQKLLNSCWSSKAES